jgi:hypothetical protein
MLPDFWLRAAYATTAIIGWNLKFVRSQSKITGWNCSDHIVVLTLQDDDDGGYSFFTEVLGLSAWVAQMCQVLQMMVCFWVWLKNKDKYWKCEVTKLLSTLFGLPFKPYYAN